MLYARLSRPHDYADTVLDRYASDTTMPIPIFITALLAMQEPQNTTVAPQVAAPVAVAAPDFTVAPTVAEPHRLALTPKMDGVIANEEWDLLTSTKDAKTYFQWEPGKLYFAGSVPEGDDLLVSLDLRANGWLVGADNYEIRVGMHDGQLQVTARKLDVTRVQGPQWIEEPVIGMASKVIAKTDNGVTTYEVALEDGGFDIIPDDKNSKLSLRIDPIAASAPSAEPFVPRALTPVSLGFSRAAALPANLQWGVENSGAKVVPGDKMRVRFTFNGSNQLGLQRIKMRSEGLAAMSSAESALPFPSFDNKSRAFVDYNTPVANDADFGYRVVQASVEDKDGVSGFVEASYQVVPPLEIDPESVHIASKPMAQKGRLTYTVSANASGSRRIDGNVRVTLPREFAIINGDDRNFSIYFHSPVRRTVEFNVPAGTKGVFPVTFRMESNGKTYDSTSFIVIE